VRRLAAGSIRLHGSRGPLRGSQIRHATILRFPGVADTATQAAPEASRAVARPLAGLLGDSLEAQLAPACGRFIRAAASPSPCTTAPAHSSRASSHNLHGAQPCGVAKHLRNATAASFLQQHELSARMPGGGSGRSCRPCHRYVTVGSSRGVSPLATPAGVPPARHAPRRARPPGRMSSQSAAGTPIAAAALLWSAVSAERAPGSWALAPAK